MALVRGADGKYVPREVELSTLADPVGMQGGVVRMMGGARVVLDANDPQLTAATTPAQLQAALLKDAGRPVHASYIEQNGVLWPADFHTWNLVTAYHAFEQAAAYFRDTGAVPEDALDPVTVYYFPTFVMAELSREPLVDNALFFSPIQGFLLLPFEQLQEAPLSINAGVLAHEYAHRIFNKRVYGGQALPAPLSLWLTGGATPGLNALKALDEGLADFHAVGASCRTAYGCDTRFLDTSFEDAVSNGRDLEGELCMDELLANALNTQGVGTFTGYGLEYRVGSLVASALWQAGRGLGQLDVLQQAVLDAYDDPSPERPGLAQLLTLNLSTPHLFNLAVGLNAIVAHLEGNLDLQKAVCAELFDHVALTPGELPACPASAVDGPTCKDLP